MLTELEKFLISDECKADKEFISNGVVLLKKDCLFTDCLKTIKTQDYPLHDEIGINHFDGEVFKLPDYIKLEKNRVLVFEFDDNYGINYELVKMFYDHFECNLHFKKTYINNEESLPALKVFEERYYGIENEYGINYQISLNYVGLIAGMDLRKNRGLL